MKMKTMRLMLATSLVCSASAVASADKPPLRSAPMGAKIKPVSVLRVSLVDGEIQPVGDWVECDPFKDRLVTDECLFDCFGRVWGPTATGAPEDCGNSCAGFLPPGSRWYFGETYHNPLTEGDMTVHGTGDVSEVDFAWFWYAGGPATSEQCYMAVFATDGDATQCKVSTSGSGFVINFGVLGSGSGLGYYYSNVDLTGLGMTLGTETGIQVVLANDFDGSTLTLCTLGQMMLWGAPNNLPNPGCPGSCGEQYDGELGDIAPTDGVLDPTTECYSSAFGLCPNPVQFMLAWGGGTPCLATRPCPADFNGDGFVSGDDFDAYVDAFLIGTAPADFNCDGFVTGDDFDGFVAAFQLGC